MSSSARTAAAREPAASVPPRFHGLLRASTAFVAACMLLQGITAGQLLDGAEHGSEIHRNASGFLVAALLVTIAAAILVRRARSPPPWRRPCSPSSSSVSGRTARPPSTSRSASP
ncbi:hypothetical protein [Actinomadura rifamycini]|uniref:hypothetical protein n=1 Tax=Actinomadura rifamycini TaxID=31962 RepID=UPI0003FF5F14|nr:hypothetical protein [Actinomadura rifamycini]